ncbi:MAG: bifunctional 5,10-methylenetetrahydrofolate dehydrogenase/5,10-methenyltetrahydrofolate cyclohydrolase [Planctomycetota bacterium]
MTARLIDGKALAKGIMERLRAEVKELSSIIPPIKLVSIDVGENPASALFIRNQQRTAEPLGILFEHEHLAAGTTEDQLIAFIRVKNDDPSVTGIIVQRPLPPGINVRRIQSKVHPDKDVEGMNPANMGFIVIGEPKLVPCTALAAIKILLSTGISPRGQEISVIGHSEIVGKPIAFLLLNLFATVTVCHIATQDLAQHTKEADVVFVAVGKPGLVRGDMLKPGATVIDIGINQVPVLGPDGSPVLREDGLPATRVVGDVDQESAMEVAGILTPVPGGVGPVTVATLLTNAVIAARLQHRLEVDPLLTAM